MKLKNASNVTLSIPTLLELEAGKTIEVPAEKWLSEKDGKKTGVSLSPFVEALLKTGALVILKDDEAKPEQKR
jgi:hypothetical protein